VTVKIPLTRGKFALVDDEDAELFFDQKWQASRGNQKSEKFYATRQIKRKTIYMHRIVIKAPPGVLVDHINNDGLDNRKSNLRLCTNQQNIMNRRYKVGESGFIGVHPAANKWRTDVVVCGEKCRVTGLSTPEFAARVRDALVREFHGEFAVLNSSVTSLRNFNLDNDQ